MRPLIILFALQSSFLVWSLQVAEKNSAKGLKREAIMNHFVAFIP